MFKRHYIILALMVLLTLAIFSLPSQTMAKFKLAVSSLFLPLFGWASSAQQVAEKAGNHVLPRQDLLRQNEQLRRENAQLRLRASQSDEIWRENAQLRRLLAWAKLQPTKYKLGRIIARDPANWWRTVQIDLGSRDGLRPNLPVRTMEGLVGRITLVGTTRSQITLLGDPTLRVGALIQETRETGIILAGSSSADHNTVELGYLARNSDIKPGQIIVTSGDGGVFPRGIPIGQIVDSSLAESGLAREARIKLFAKMNRLEEVWVVMP